MNSVGAFIHQDCDGRIGSGIRDVFHHVRHDDGIANYQAHAPTGAFTEFSAQHFSQVETREFHQACGTDYFLHRRFQVGKRFRRRHIIAKCRHIGVANGCVEFREDVLE